MSLLIVIILAIVVCNLTGDVKMPSGRINYQRRAMRSCRRMFR